MGLLIVSLILVAVLVLRERHRVIRLEEMKEQDMLSREQEMLENQYLKTD